MRASPRNATPGKGGKLDFTGKTERETPCGPVFDGEWGVGRTLELATCSYGAREGVKLEKKLGKGTKSFLPDIGR